MSGAGLPRLDQHMSVVKRWDSSIPASAPQPDAVPDDYGNFIGLQVWDFSRQSADGDGQADASDRAGDGRVSARAEEEKGKAAALQKQLLASKDPTNLLVIS